MACRQIAKCVGEVLAESRQKQTPRNTQKRVLTESQLQSYIQNVINEEMEKEGTWDKGIGMVKGLFDGLRGGAKATRAQTKYDKEKEEFEKNGGKKPQKPIQNNRKSMYQKIKTTVADYGADADRNAEFNSLIKKLEKLQVNGYFDSRDDIYDDVNKLIEKLQYFMKYQNGVTRGNFKKNFGYNKPQKEQTETANGMNRGRTSGVSPMPAMGGSYA